MPPRSGVHVQPPRRGHGQEGGPQPPPRRGGHEFWSPPDQVRLSARRSNKLQLCLFLLQSRGSFPAVSFGTSSRTATHLEHQLTNLFPPLRMPPLPLPRLPALIAFAQTQGAGHLFISISVKQIVVCGGRRATAPDPLHHVLKPSPNIPVCTCLPSGEKVLMWPGSHNI